MNAIILDLDGTLLNSNKNIPPKTKELLINFQKKDGILVLASGRSFNGIIGFAKDLSMHLYNGYIISYNGARLYSTYTGKAIWEDVIKK